MEEENKKHMFPRGKKQARGRHFKEQAGPWNQMVSEHFGWFCVILDICLCYNIGVISRSIHLGNRKQPIQTLYLLACNVLSFVWTSYRPSTSRGRECLFSASPDHLVLGPASYVPEISACGLFDSFIPLKIPPLHDVQ